MDSLLTIPPLSPFVNTFFPLFSRFSAAGKKRAPDPLRKGSGAIYNNGRDQPLRTASNSSTISFSGAGVRRLTTTMATQAARKAGSSS